MGGALVWGACMIGTVWRLSEPMDWTGNQSQRTWNDDWTSSPGRIEQIRYEQKQVECLAQNVYHEARGEEKQGKIAVAAVTMNRVHHRAWGRDVCSVVWEDSAFSWTLDRSLWDIKETKSYAQAVDVARAVYYGVEADPTGGATHYHTINVNPYWSASGVEKMRIGAHIFMKMRSGGR